jgi:hypothetical protein
MEDLLDREKATGVLGPLLESPMRRRMHGPLRREPPRDRADLFAQAFSHRSRRANAELARRRPCALKHA